MRSQAEDSAIPLSAHWKLSAWIDLRSVVNNSRAIGYMEQVSVKHLEMKTGHCVYAADKERGTQSVIKCG